MTIDSEKPKTPAAFWKEVTTPFRGPIIRRSVLQLTTTLGGFLLLWTAMFLALEISYFLSLALAVPTGLFVVRLFMIQHDCGHGSYFRSRRLADWTGFFLGVITLTPYKYWAQTHNYHHSHSGDLGFRGVGDISTLTVREYEALSRRKRLLYRLYRNPAVLLFIGPLFHFIIKHRYPWDIPSKWRHAWRSVWLTNLCLLAIVFLMGETMGYGRFFMLQFPVTAVACCAGVWLFYVQHQFEHTYWQCHENWDYFKASLKGSSHLVLPRLLQWLTASIGIHHVHHLSSQIPNYRLEECMLSNSALQEAEKITLLGSLRLLGLSLWDEEREELISFRRRRQRMQTSEA